MKLTNKELMDVVYNRTMRLSLEYGTIPRHEVIRQLDSIKDAMNALLAAVQAVPVTAKAGE